MRYETIWAHNSTSAPGTAKFTVIPPLLVSYVTVSEETPIEEGPIREGLCVFCGTSRPVTKPICPTCRCTWIDTKIGEELPALTPEIVAASAEEREAAANETPPGFVATERRRPWGLLIGAAVALVAVAVVFFGVLDSDDNGDDVAAAGTTTTVAVATTVAPTSTTAGSTTAPATTATTSTTSSTTTTTTAPTTTLPPIEPEGDPVALENLTLGAFALGPFDFDADAAYLGRLVASLGQPDTRVDAGTEHGLCPDDTGTAYTWGALTAIFRVEGEREILVGYHLDETGTDHPTQAITTRSGLELGHTIEKLDAIYLQSGLALETIDGAPVFLLLRSTDDATLLWGPVSSTDQDGLVEGIYSPQACDGGPRPSI